MSEVVNTELPEGWESVPLKDAVQVILGQSPKSSTYNQEGEGLPFFQGKTEFGEIYPTVRKWCTEPKKIAEAEDVLVSVRAPVGPTNLAPYECAIGRGLAALRPLGGSDSKYFLYLIRRYQESLAALGTGTTFEAISGDTLKNFVVPIAPPEQQKRIVAKIEELFSHIDAGIEALKKAKQLLKQYRQSVLKAAVTGELTKEWREANKDKLEPASKLLEQILKERCQKWEEFESEKHRVTNKFPKNDNWKKRYKEPIEFDFDDEIELPTEWEQTSLDAVTDLLTDYHANGSYKVLKEYVVLKDEPDYSIYIRSKNFEKEDFANDLKYVSEEAYEKLWKSKLFGGELVVGKIGNAGRVYFMPKPAMPTTLGMNLFMLRLNKHVNNKYIYYVLKSGLGSLQISRRVKGVGNPTIDKVSLKNICIPLPCRKEQDSIVELIEDNLEKINRLEKDIDSQFLNVEKNKQSILASVFSGGLQ